MIKLPLKFTHNSNPKVVYTAKSEEDGIVTITWIDDYRKEDSTTYSSGAVEAYIRDGVWVPVEPKIDLRTALKVRLFEMRIADMEASLAALKQEFELHKQDVKGLH